MRPVIIVFAKAPVPGRVKTRLIPPFSPRQAAALHTAFVLDTIESLESLTQEFEIELHLDRETPAWPELQLPVRLQHEGDLGLKMFKALGYALNTGHPGAIVLGSDSPNLPPAHLQWLAHSGSEVSLGPTDDGGYYAIAARRVHPDMFSGVRWSTEEALHDTLRACVQCGLSVDVGPAWFDIDSSLDVERLQQCEPVPRYTLAALQLALEPERSSE